MFVHSSDGRPRAPFCGPRPRKIDLMVGRLGSWGAAFEKKSHDPLTRVDQREGARVEGRVKV